MEDSSHSSLKNFLTKFTVVLPERLQLPVVALPLVFFAAEVFAAFAVALAASFFVEFAVFVVVVYFAAVYFVAAFVECCYQKVFAHCF